MGQPFMQLYVGDYMGDTPHFSTTQHGAYLLILMAMWRHGGMVANDERQLAKIARLSLDKWRKVGGPVMDKFEIVGDQLTQGRLARELEKAHSKSEKRASAGRAGAAAKALKSKRPSKASAKALLKHLPEPEEEKKREKGAKAPLLPGMTFPDWWPTEAWRGFVEQRKKARKPLSDAAVEVAIRRLTELRAQGQNPVLVLEKATLGSWSGLYAVDDKAGPKLVAAAGVTIEQWMYRLRAWHMGIPDDGVSLEVPKGFWDKRWGPSPAKGAKIPPEAESEFNRRFPAGRVAAR